MKEEEVDDDDVLYGHANLIYENSGEKESMEEEKEYRRKRERGN